MSQQRGLTSILVTAFAAAAAMEVAAQQVDHFDPVIVAYDIPPARAAYCALLTESYPPLPGFRMQLFSEGGRAWPFGVPEEADAELRDVARIVGEGLGDDGFRTTLARSIEKLVHNNESRLSGGSAAIEERLLDAGFPVDLTRYFHPPQENGRTKSFRMIDDLVEAIGNGLAGAELVEHANRWTFAFEPTLPNGVAMPDRMLDTERGAVRMQLTRGDDWLAPMDGGSVDIARQLVEAFPALRVYATLEKKHLTGFLMTSQSWHATTGAFMIAVTPFSTSQWARDNGVLFQSPPSAKGSSETDVILTPRYASRRDEASLFVPGDSFAMNAFETLGLRVHQSPLLFQGGNLTIVQEPGRAGRTLMVGEAEIRRNRALGLTADEVIAAFKTEFGAETCCVLPAISFHVDLDVCFRSHGDQYIAFVADDRAGAVLVLNAGVAALANAGRIEANAAKDAGLALERNDPKKFLSIIGPVLARSVDRKGHFPESFARHFSTGPADSHVGNLRLFLVAMDTFVHGAARSSNTFTTEYLASFDRLEEDRKRLNDMLAARGWRIVTIPTLGQGERMINPLNGIQCESAYLMPAVGGLYTCVDDASAGIFRREMGPDVRIIRIRCGETQRRAGGLHCAIAVQGPPTTRADGD